MKKHNLFKVVAIFIILLVLCSWFFPVVDIQNGAFVEGEKNRIGIFSIILSLAIATQYFSNIILYIFAIGVFYGVLYKIPSYRKLLDYIADGFRGYEWLFIGLIMLLFTLLSSMVGLSLPLLFLFPMVISIVLLLGYDKITAVMVTVGSVMVGLIGTVFSVSAAQGQTYYLGLQANTHVLSKILLLVVCFAIMYLNTLRYAKKHNNNINDDELLIPKRIPTRKSFWPLAITIDLVIIVLGLAYFSWDLFGINIFQDAYQKISNPSGGAKAIFESIGTIIGASDINVFGSWDLIDCSAVLFLASGLIAFMYRMKFDEFLSSAAKGAKKAFKPAMLVLFIYSAFILIAKAPTYFAWLRGILTVGGDLNIFLMVIVAIVFAVVCVESVYQINYSSGYALSLAANNSFIIGLIYQSMYGLTMLVAPTSIVLMVSLSYLHIPYGKWLKAIWLVALEMFGAIMILLLIFNRQNNVIKCNLVGEKGEITATATLDGSQSLKKFEAKYHFIIDTDEEYSATCESLKKIATTENGREEVVDCHESSKTIDFTYIFDMSKITEEERANEVLSEILSFESDGKIDVSSWMSELESQGYTCSK